ncbi:glutamate receptor ionotropic, delta-1 isoform X2 [Drosophila takahashii]|uniref:glutamate receptor ionotropic, delta-1 isoform X2 n=1 Tax=Drosophila takahashii TaxID=29030 RepID=UPI0038993DA0
MWNRQVNTNSNARDIGVSEDSDLRNVYIDGTETRVVLNFCEKFNCTIEIDTSDANDWGNVYPNMSGDGALGMVINHKADICIGAMYSWSEDYSYLDLSMYLVRSGITCLVPAPMRLASWYLPLEPFQESLWAAILLCLCMETIGLILAYKSEQELYVPPSYRDGWWKCTKFGLSTTFKLLISQSGNSKANSLTVRALLFVCFLNDLIITSIYGGGLASILTVPSMDEAADTVQRLRLHRLQWAANSEAWVSAIRGSDEPLVRDLLNNFHIYNDDRLLRLAQEQMVRIGFTVERLPSLCYWELFGASSD